MFTRGSTTIFFPKYWFSKTKYWFPPLENRLILLKQTKSWDMIICNKKHLEIRIFRPNIWYPIHSGRKPRKRAKKGVKLEKIPPKNENCPHYNLLRGANSDKSSFCYTFSKIREFFAHIYGFYPNLFEINIFHIKNNVKLHNFASFFQPEWFSKILGWIAKIEKNKYIFMTIRGGPRVLP